MVNAQEILEARIVVDEKRKAVNDAQAALVEAQSAVVEASREFTRLVGEADGDALAEYSKLYKELNT